MKLRRCTQCGAPLEGYKCDYCDSEYEREAGDNEQPKIDFKSMSEYEFAALQRKIAGGRGDEPYVALSDHPVYLSPMLYGEDREITFKTMIHGRQLGVWLKTGTENYRVPTFVEDAVKECDLAILEMFGDQAEKWINQEYARRKLLQKMEKKARERYSEHERDQGYQKT